MRERFLVEWNSGQSGFANIMSCRDRWPHSVLTSAGSLGAIVAVQVDKGAGLSAFTKCRWLER